MSNQKKETKVLSKDVLNKIKDFNKSGQIRYLHSLDYSQGDISRILTKLHKKLVRPQHVNNVLRTPVTNPVNKF